MTFLNETRIGSTGLVERLQLAVETYRANARRRRVERETYHALSALSKRELWDLGIDRSQISSIARESARDVK